MVLLILAETACFADLLRSTGVLIDLPPVITEIYPHSHSEYIQSTKQPLVVSL